MQIYLVGGAVRDRLLGIPNHDRDWVVVGGSAQELAAQGFIPVGQDFPVFLHPETHEEYALARTERKHGRGYAGFTFFTGSEVTLEEDLSRRDLTINAMAVDANGRLIDPFGGKKDLESGILRHIGPAFAEDPVRILRVARFAARYGFTVAEETRQLMRTMTANGEVSALVPERVWQETAKGLMEKTPSKMFDVLRDCGAAAVILPEIDALFGVPQRADYHPEIDCGRHTMMALDYAAAQDYTLPERYAVLCHDLGKALTPKEILPKHHGHEQRGIVPVKTLNKRLNVPRECASLALMAAEYHGNLHAVGGLRAATIADILHHCDALRRPERFQAALRVCVADTRGRLTFENAPYPQKEMWEKYLSGCLNIDNAAIAAAQDNPQKIPEAVRSARIDVIRALQAQDND